MTSLPLCDRVVDVTENGTQKIVGHFSKVKDDKYIFLVQVQVKEQVRTSFSSILTFALRTPFAKKKKEMLLLLKWVVFFRIYHCNKKVPLRERKRHTTQGVASTCSAVLSQWGGGVGHPDLAVGVPKSCADQGGTPT